MATVALHIRSAWQQARLLTLVELALWGAIGTLLLVGFARVVPLLLRTPDMGDFAAYYRAGVALQDGQALYVPINGRYIGGFLYAPIIGWAFQPFALVDEATAKTIWYVCNLFFLCAAIVLTYAMIPLQQRWQCWLLATCICVWPATYDSLAFGQINIFLYVLLVGAILLLEKQHAGAAIGAGVLIGLTITIKIFFVLLVPVLMFHRRHQVWIGAAISGILFVVLGGIVVGRETTLTYFTDVLFHVGQEFTSSPVNQSLRGVAARLFAPNTFRFGVLNPGTFNVVNTEPLVYAPSFGQWFATGCSILALVITYITILRRRYEIKFDIGIVITIMLASLPVAWDYYYVFILMPIITWLPSYFTHSRSARLMFLVAVLLLVLHRYWRYLTLIAVSPLLMLFGCLGVLCLWGLMLGQRWRTTKSS